VTNHVWDTVRYWVYMATVRAGHLALLYVYLMEAVSEEREYTADEAS